VVEVTLKLPATNIPGRVVDQGGHGVPGAAVFVMQTDGEKPVGQAVSGNKGRFELRGLKPGEVWLTAAGPTGVAQARRVDLREGLRTESLELTLEPLMPRRIRLLTDAGPLAGASVWYRAGGEGPRFEKQAISQPDGVAILSLPRSTTIAEIQVLPGSYAMKVTSATLSPVGAEPIDIFVNRWGAHLHLDVGELSAGQFFLFKDGIRLPSVSAMVHWARMTTGQSVVLTSVGEIAIPKADWGFYVLCRSGTLGTDERQLLQGRGIPENCSGGYLEPGSHLSLQMKR
jgi:hypothetical protein